MGEGEGEEEGGRGKGLGQGDREDAVHRYIGRLKYTARCLDR